MTDGELPPDLAAGDFITFRWLNAIKAFIRRNQVFVARDCGLTCKPGEYGKIIGYEPVERVYLGITTTTILARAAKVVHYGTVQPYTLSGNTLVIAGPTVQVANWTGSVIPTNVWIKYFLMNHQYVFNGNDCSGVAP